MVSRGAAVPPRRPTSMMFFHLGLGGTDFDMNEKRLQWELIKEKAPDVADWLISINTVFGKPKAMRVEMSPSGDVLETGDFDGPRIIFDGKARIRYGKR